MTTTCDHVSKGDLITAKFMNECVLGRLKQIEDRLAKLESTAAPSISQIIPDPIDIKNVVSSFTMEIHGQNFSTNKKANGVTVGPLQMSVVSANNTKLTCQFLDMSTTNRVLEAVLAAGEKISVKVVTPAGQCEKSVSITYGSKG